MLVFSPVSLFKWGGGGGGGGICAAPTTDAVATGEISCYNLILISTALTSMVCGDDQPGVP